MDTVNYIQTFLSFVFVISLIGLVGFIARKILQKNSFYQNNNHFHLKHTCNIDGKRKIVVVDDKQYSYTVLLGQTETLVNKVKR